jgi:hypothetical protein
MAAINQPSNCPIIHDGYTQLISSGAGTIKMCSSNAATNVGFLEVVLADGNLVYIPYWSDATP